MTSIYLIRHAQAVGNAEGRFQGRTDSPLTEQGLRQAQRLNWRFQAIPLSAVYTSPLQRARQTAQAIAGPRGLELIPHPGLIEIDGGEMENLAFEEMAARYPKEFKIFDKEPHLFKGVGGGESILSVYTRMVDAVGEIAKRHPDENVAVISHGCAIRCYLCFARAHPLERLGEGEWGGNTCVTHVVYRNGKASLMSVADNSHLEGWE